VRKHGLTRPEVSIKKVKSKSKKWKVAKGIWTKGAGSGVDLSKVPTCKLRTDLIYQQNL